MARTVEAPVNAEVLGWARRTAGIAEIQAAKKAGVALERLRAWEGGGERPSIAQLRALADLYKRPLAVFFLREMPVDFSVMRAFRRVPETDETKLSPALAIQTRQALIRRDVAVELTTRAGDELPLFTPVASLSTAPEEAASETRTATGIEFAEQTSWTDERTAYRRWRAAVEGLGVFVFQVSRVKVAEMRGLSMFLPLQPVILVNAADSVRGRIFSLAHELGHLLLHQQQVCDPAAEMRLRSDGQDAEVWCNAFAGSLLVPADVLKDEHKVAASPSEVDWDETRRLADRFKVSQEVILRRLVTIGRLGSQAYSGARQRLLQAEIPKAKKKSGGGPKPDVKALSNLGLPFVRTVLSALHRREITLSDVADYFDVKVKHVSAIERRAIGGDLKGDDGVAG
jgi:Zn-dependent peptidase ImmA (M78 family)